jgi:hypothetical protein
VLKVLVLEVLVLEVLVLEVLEVLDVLVRGAKVPDVRW